MLYVIKKTCLIELVAWQFSTLNRERNENRGEKNLIERKKNWFCDLIYFPTHVNKKI